MKFPDEKMIEAIVEDCNSHDPHDESNPTAQLVREIIAAYSTRTGIDVGDIIEKLSAGTHELTERSTSNVQG